jgi:leucyl aminopeptidase
VRVPQLALSTTGAAGSDADAVVVGTVQGESGLELAPGAERLDAAFGGELRAALASLGATGKTEEVVKLASLGRVPARIVLAAGLGSQGTEVDSRRVRRASGAATRALAGTPRVLSALAVLDLRAAAEGTVLGGYSFGEYKKSGSEPPGSVEFVANGDAAGHHATLRAASTIGEAVCTARDLVNTPPNDLFPDAFARRAADLATQAGLDVEVLDEEELRTAGYGGILGVGGGSARPPRLVRIRYAGDKPRAKVALVGKGITFDTGGISIKPNAGMNEMTADMAGAAAMVASVVLAAKLGYPLEVTATVPMAENMPSASAYRPGDVLRMYSGRTVEVLNTDAEGRLILGDALARACEDRPDYLIDAATLTGAQSVALGKRTMGVMGTEAFRDRVAELGTALGEAAWPMPLPEELREDLDSYLADIANVAGHRFGGMLVAGHFLREFVAGGVEWAHLDVAGPAFNGGSPHGFTPKGGTGVPVRTIAAALADIAEQRGRRG